MNKHMWIVILGSVAQGCSFYGPFKTSDDAIYWAENNCHSLSWEIAPLDVVNFRA